LISANGNLDNEYPHLVIKNPSKSSFSGTWQNVIYYWR
jgi:hypothetical protein